MKNAGLAIFVALIIISGYFFLSKPVVAPSESLTEKSETEPQIMTGDTSSSTESASSTNYQAENITIESDSLSPNQQKTLETLGIEGDIEITPEMIACAEEKVGKERLDEIINGDTPSFLEGVSLVSCY